VKPRASIWIVTYRNEQDLNANLDSLFQHWQPDLMDIQVNVINNHTQFKLNSAHWDKVQVWHNRLRSDQSLGHLSRNWNQALVQGFQNLDQPRVEFVINSQDDVIWQPGWCASVLKETETYNLISQGVGDAVVVYKIDAVKNIGLWDERFCPSFYHDGDYFLRALIYNKQFSSINDPAHGRILNPLAYAFAVVPAANAPRVDAKNLSYGKAHLPFLVWKNKWATNPIHWSQELIDNPPAISQCYNYVQYPHFETNLADLAARNYLV